MSIIDCIEADGAVHNIRALRNVCLNAAGNAFSTQTLYGGPAYFMRNIAYNVPNIPKQHANPSGEIYYHNTFVSESAAGPSSNYHFRNNLFLDAIPQCGPLPDDPKRFWAQTNPHLFIVNAASLRFPADVFAYSPHFLLVPFRAQRE